MNDIKMTILFDAETFDGYPMQFRYNGSLTINVYTGLRDEFGEFIDPVETDIITLSESGISNAAEAVERFLADYAKEEMPEGCGKWGCKDCYPDED